MSQIINWICLISVILLVLDVMIYFCNDAIKIYNKSYNKSTRMKTKPAGKTRAYAYEDKIAK